jgi:uncharacterized protein
MTTSLDEEPDLEALDAFLMSDQTPDECMMLCDLDGFLTGIAIGPELVAPSEWLPYVWGGHDQPIYDDDAQMEAIVGAIMRRYNQILGQVAEGVAEPIFMRAHSGEIIASDWAEGFLQAMQIRRKAWEKLFQSDDHFDCLIPILALCSDERGGSLLGLSQELEDQFFASAGDVIPGCILDIAEFWLRQRPDFQRGERPRKTGRNDPCPCGSGKKYKKCCGLDG